jgi:hypothetical protein
MNKKYTAKQLAAFNETYKKYPGELRRFVDKQGIGGLAMQCYQGRTCGCRVIGNGTIQFPLTVEPCAKHLSVHILHDTEAVYVL